MKQFIRSLTAAAVVVATIGTLSVALAGGASASGGTPPWEPDGNSVGSLIFYNAAGAQITGGNVTDAPLAAYVQGTNTVRSGDTKATLFGYLPVDGQVPGTWSGEGLSASDTYPNAAAPGTLGSSALPLVTGTANDETIGELASDFPNLDTTTDGYAGMYQLRLKTSVSGLGETSTYDSVDIQITGSTWSVVYPAPTLATTSTSLTTTPSSPQVYGTSVALNAQVSPDAPGTVQFENGSTDIGSPVTVASNGTASLSSSTLPVGDDSLSAIFTPSQFAAYSGSTGDDTFDVEAPPAAGTTTALSVDPTTAAADTSVDITAAISVTSNSDALASGTGQVTFYDDGSDSSGDITSDSVDLGTDNVGSGGLAQISDDSFAVGAHNIVAQFVPTDSSVYETSTSEAVLFTATTPAIAPAAQSIETAIPSGSLTITTPYSSSSPFQLGTAALNADATEFTASAPFGSVSSPTEGVTITDTRAGDLPWTASATVTNFTNGSGGIINAQNLTFTDVTPAYIIGNALQSGSVTTSNITNSEIYGPTATGTDGLSGGPHEFATATEGAGSVYIDGVLTLISPTSTPGGEYTATLTFTVS
jgi:hypothetical protein